MLELKIKAQKHSERIKSLKSENAYLRKALQSDGKIEVITTSDSTEKEKELIK